MIARMLLTVCLILPALAGAADELVLPDLALETYTLDNGLQVILHQDPALPLVTVNIWYHVGSRDEEPGRTGFAHLFEHMMFQGSAHHDEDYFVPLQNVGGRVNGSTNTDRTNYWQEVPSGQLELALRLEADRMGWLLPAMTQAKLDNQRDVVKNEKRQQENRPYSRSREILHRLLFPAGHPYRWLTIGSMDDLTAASLDDVKAFFRNHYVPNNATLCVAGDFDPDQARRWIAEAFGPIPPGPDHPRVTEWIPTLPAEVRAVDTDDVAAPRVYLNWHTPGYYAPGDAEFDLLGEILAGGKTSRLHRRLVRELRVAQDVSARQLSREMSGVFEIRATAAPGRTAAEVEAAIDAELDRLLEKGVTDDEVRAARAGFEAGFVRGLQEIGGFGGRADRLNRYAVFAGDPDYLQRDFDRFRNARAGTITAWARRYLGTGNRAVLHIVPLGKRAEAGPDTLDRTVLPAGVPEAPFVPPVILSDTLANGLRVAVVTDRSLPLIQFRLEFLSGWSRDPAGRAGTAALTADLLDEGAGGRDAVELAAAAERLGARLRTLSTFDGSTVTLDVLSDRVDDGLELLRDVVREPEFAPDEFGRVRDALLARQAQEARRPREQAIKTFQAECFGADHPYAQPYTGAGEAAALAALTLDDVRAFHRDHYVPGNAVLIVAGDVDLAGAVALANDAFGDWPAGAVPAAAVPAPAPAAPGVVVVDRPRAEQSFIVGGYPAPSRRDPAAEAIDVVNGAFGGQFTSRINLNLREDKGYTYGVRSTLLSLRDGGAFLMTAPVETGVTAAAMQELLAEMRAIAGPRPLAGDELAEGRNRLVKGFPREFATRADVAAAVGELVRNGLPLDDWAGFAGRVAAVDSAAAAHVVARLITPDALRWVVVGDAATVVPQLEAAGLGPIEVRPVE